MGVNQPPPASFLAVDRRRLAAVVEGVVPHPPAQCPVVRRVPDPAVDLHPHLLDLEARVGDLVEEVLELPADLLPPLVATGRRHVEQQDPLVLGPDFGEGLDVLAVQEPQHALFQLAGTLTGDDLH